MSSRAHFWAACLLAPWVFLAIPIRAEELSPITCGLWTVYAIEIMIDWLEGVE